MCLILLSQALALEPINLHIEYSQISGASFVHELPPDRQPNHQFDLTLDLHVIGPFYMANTIRSYISGPQFSLVGWHFEVGAIVLPFLHLFIRHKSEHLLDGAYKGHFPLKDEIGVRIKII